MQVTVQYLHHIRHDDVLGDPDWDEVRRRVMQLGGRKDDKAVAERSTFHTLYEAPEDA